MKSIPELFHAQAKLSPDAIALTFRDVALTYRELDTRVDELASRLARLGVAPGVRVALCLERSIELVVAMLAILRAGGAYVPLDLTHPPQRLGYILTDAQPLALLTQARLQARLPTHDTPVILLDAPPAADPAPTRVDDRETDPGDIAYVIYTSGSTGEPKGVEVEHRAVANLLASMQRRPGFTAEDTLLAITTPAFDISVLELFLPLVCGARLVVAPGDIVGDGAALIELIDRSQATVLQSTPSTLRMLLDAGWEGSPTLKLLCGGEAWPTELASQLLPRCASLWNMYGPTETTVWSAVAKVEPGQPVVIGQPIANTRLYVLDTALQLVPVGVPGELHIGGAGLARGYLNRGELTRERFIVDPFASTPGARMYRTGDLVRRMSGGAIEFVGRMDHQVKIRGHRIELGEIEVALQRQPALEQCVVVAREDPHGDQRLVAYVIAAAGHTIVPRELRAQLAETLPSYMIPAHYVSLDAFPVTPNGKLDRMALPSPEMLAQGVETSCRGPRTSEEGLLAQIWCEMLGLDHVGMNDNFFDLGGHSLLATRVIGRINQLQKGRVSVSAFFHNPTIEGLAALLEQDLAVRPEPRLLQLQEGDSGLPLCFIGTGMGETQIAQSMTDGRPVFLVDMPIPVAWSEAIDQGRHEELPTVEELGDSLAELILPKVGSSPCVIAGYSMWGRVAFEVVRALQRRGCDVACVLLLDARVHHESGTRSGVILASWRWIWRRSEAVDAPRRGRFASIKHSLTLLGFLVARIPNAARNRVNLVTNSLSKAKNRFTPAGTLTGYLDSDGVPIPYSGIKRLNRVIGKSYRPGPVDTSGVLIRAQLSGYENLPGYDSTYEWKGLFVKGLEVLPVSGGHFALLTEENVARMRQLINDVIERYELTKHSPRPDTAFHEIARKAVGIEAAGSEFAS